MKYALIKHHENSEKSYWFRVPRIIESRILVGMEVYCDTKLGCEWGRIVDLKDSVEGINPCKNIMAVKEFIPIFDIKISKRMQRSRPKEDKLVKRREEYKNTGRFNTRIFIRNDGLLLDGYTAYLVAVELGHSALEGFRYA